jgi:hypothetical protein
MAEGFFMLGTEKKKTRVRRQVERVFSEVEKVEIHRDVAFPGRGYEVEK